MKPQISTVVASMLFAAVAAAHADVVISTKPTQNMTCSSGLCTATAKKAVLNVTDFANLLSSGDVAIQSGGVAKDIKLKAALSWVSASHLTLDANRSIEFDKAVTVAGPGALTITTNDGGSGGDFRFFGKGHVEFWDKSSSLIIGGMPYKLIRNISELEHFVRRKPAGFYALTRDYNAQKDGTHDHQFIPDLTGVIEGLGHTVSNFTMNSSNSDIGFLSENHGILRDLTLANISVSGGDGLVAGLVGHNLGTIQNCGVSGHIIGDVPQNGYLGGLVAENDGVITGSHTSATVDGSAGYVTGGLVGFSFVDGTIKTSYATGSVTGSGATGGLIGLNEGSVDQSYATGVVSGPGVAGGLIGSNDGIGTPTGTVTNVYATGSVAGSTAGGLVGESGGNPIVIANAYSIGAVSGSPPIGGFAGQDNREVIATSYWDLDTSGISDPAQGAGSPQNDPGITGLSDVQLKSGLPAGFDPSIWEQKTKRNSGYPYLIDNPPQ